MQWLSAAQVNLKEQGICSKFESYVLSHSSPFLQSFRCCGVQNEGHQFVAFLQDKVHEHTEDTNRTTSIQLIRTTARMRRLKEVADLFLSGHMMTSDSVLPTKPNAISGNMTPTRTANAVTSQRRCWLASTPPLSPATAPNGVVVPFDVLFSTRASVDQLSSVVVRSIMCECVLLGGNAEFLTRFGSRAVLEAPQ